MRISSAQYRHIRIKYARHARGRGCVRAKYKRRAREAKRRAGTNKGRSHCSCRIARRHGQKRNAAPKTSKAIPVERNAAYRTKYPQERLMAVTQPALTRMSKQCPATTPAVGLAAAAQPTVHQSAKTKAPRQPMSQGSQFAKQQQKVCSDSRRRPSLLLTARTPAWQIRRSRSFPYRPSTQPRLRSSEPSRPHNPCRRRSYGRRRWSPCQARSRCLPQIAR